MYRKVFKIGDLVKTNYGDPFTIISMKRLYKASEPDQLRDDWSEALTMGQPNHAREIATNEYGHSGYWAWAVKHID